MKGERLREETVKALIKSTAVAIIRMPGPEHLLDIAQALYQGGITAIEISLTTPEALTGIEAINKKLGTVIQLGAGSIINKGHVKDAIHAGARYIVSPVFKTEIIETAHKMDAPVMPGAFSPTEIQGAYEAGADFVKIFPAKMFGPAYISAVKAPLPHLRLMPTGGITCDNVDQWLKAGAELLGIGSALLDMKAISDGRFEVLTGLAGSLRQRIDAARKS